MLTIWSLRAAAVRAVELMFWPGAACDDGSTGCVVLESETLENRTASWSFSQLSALGFGGFRLALSTMGRTR